ncbi:MAG: flagellar protein [Alphaproteobacteria bacterium]|nr:flagellar protein [Alphaproteobacteria bacterium]
MADISLTASMRSNLLSLQNTQKLMDTTQERLSTGKKVNSAIDNPSSYYTAQSLNNRAGDLEALLDSMGQGIQTIKAANEGIEAITTFAQQAKAIANSARDDAAKAEPVTGKGTQANAAEGDTLSVTLNGVTKNIALLADVEVSDPYNEATDMAALATALNNAMKDTDTGFGATDGAKVTFSYVAGKGIQATVAEDSADSVSLSGTIGGITFSGEQGSNARVNYEKQFNGIMEQIDQLAKDSGYKGVNLLQNNDLTVIFNEDRSSNLLIKGVDASSSGLGLSAASKWANPDNKAIDQTIVDVDAAISKLRTMASEFGNNYSVVQNREDFTESLVNVLTEGADKLTLADMNEESANMLALQTRQQLAINSLSLASQAAQSVLSLF